MKLMKLSKRYVANVCRCAAKIIETNGWLQHGFGSPGGPRCMAGAIIEAVCDEAVCEEKCEEKYLITVLSTVRKYLPASPTSVHQPVSLWNDAEGRTKEEVCKKLRHVARELEHGGELEHG